MTCQNLYQKHQLHYRVHQLLLVDCLDDHLVHPQVHSVQSLVDHLVHLDVVHQNLVDHCVVHLDVVRQNLVDHLVHLDVVLLDVVHLDPQVELVLVHLEHHLHVGRLPVQMDYCQDAEHVVQTRMDCFQGVGHLGAVHLGVVLV